MTPSHVSWLRLAARDSREWLQQTLTDPTVTICLPLDEPLDHYLQSHFDMISIYFHMISSDFHLKLTANTSKTCSPWCPAFGEIQEMTTRLEKAVDVHMCPLEVKGKSSDFLKASLMIIEYNRCVFPLIIILIHIIYIYIYQLFSRTHFLFPGWWFWPTCWPVGLAPWSVWHQRPLEGHWPSGGERAERDDVLGPCDENDRKSC